MGSQVFWGIHQLALFFAANANELVTKEIPEVIRIKLTTDNIPTDIDQIVDDSIKQLEKRQEERYSYTILTRELEALAGLFQTKKFTFKKVLKFRNQASVRAAVDRLERAFPRP